MSDDVYLPPAAELVAPLSGNLPAIPAQLALGENFGLALRYAIAAIGSIGPIAVGFYLIAFALQTLSSFAVAALSPWVAQQMAGVFPAGVDPSASTLTPLLASTALMPLMVIAAVIQMAIQSVGAQARAYAFLEHTRTGATVAFGDSLRFGLSRWWPALRTNLLQTLFLIAGAILCVVPAVVLWTRFAFASTIVTLEPDRGPLQHSTDLVKNRGWRVFYTLFVMACINVAINLPLQWPTLAQSFAPTLVPAWLAPGTPAAIALSLLAGVVATIVGIWTSAVIVVLYLSVRAESELVEQLGTAVCPWAPER